MAAVLAYEAAAQITTVEAFAMSWGGGRDDSTEILKALGTRLEETLLAGCRDARLRDLVVHV